MTKPDLMAELAACPFCGGKAEYRSKRYSGVGASGMEAPFISAGCPKCNVWFGGGQTEGAWNPELRKWTDRTTEAHAEAAEKWNKRTHHAELEAVVRDKCRLDWLEGGNERTVFQCIGGEWCAHDGEPGVEHFGATPRDALDAAIDQAMHNSAREG